MKKFCALWLDYCSIFAPSVEVHFLIYRYHKRLWVGKTALILSI